MYVPEVKISRNFAPFQNQTRILILFLLSFLVMISTAIHPSMAIHVSMHAKNHWVCMTGAVLSSLHENMNIHIYPVVRDAKGIYCA
jgi:hypothetical protein